MRNRHKKPETRKKLSYSNLKKKIFSYLQFFSGLSGFLLIIAKPIYEYHTRKEYPIKLVDVVVIMLLAYIIFSSFRLTLNPKTKRQGYNMIFFTLLLSVMFYVLNNLK